MRTVNIHAAKTQLSRLVDAAVAARKSSSPDPASRWLAWGRSPAQDAAAVSASWPGNCACRRILTPPCRTSSPTRSKAADARAARHPCAAMGTSCTGWTQTRAPRLKAARPMCCSGPPAYGRSRSKPHSAAPISRSIPPRSLDPRSIPDLPNCRSVRMPPPSSAGCRGCTVTCSTAFFWHKQSSSPQPSTRPTGSSCPIDQADPLAHSRW